MSSDGRDALAATFEDVSPREVRCPSWIAQQNKRPPVERAARPGQLPQEFVAAFQREIKNASEAPPPAFSVPPPSRAARPVASDAPPSQGSVRAASHSPYLPPDPEPDPELVNALCEAIDHLSQARADILAQTGSQLAELAVTIARRVVGRELSLEPRIIHGLVAEGLEALGQHDRVLVLLGSGFADLVDELHGRLSRGGRRVEVRVDATLGQWGCQVETELGRVDESIDARLSTLLAALKPDSSPPGA